MVIILSLKAGITQKLMFLNKNKLLSLIDSQELIIKPLLDKDCQIGEISIDFRLGYDFLVSIQVRDSFINLQIHYNSFTQKNCL